ncbi:Uncharacterised protein [Mycobacteroides abscessus]|uniref:Uncharacterized protein n=3 Tax=Mycobacteroides abscessus TaxID=36809 RepID=A0A829HWS6_9MYCO|nr:hypothetical protein MAB47J26_05090 [Mycobacteroides abscessus 47J26]EIU62481.1 hypothetical protein MM1S1510930_2812 [Mycobacteroides abscessus subsp. bolletii 1S-151-0930]EIU68483.1 hypothetical protein MM1S1520914_3015 [Mycobacteroides abscessus subsp. bolletii 1S-152-0914]EIU75378.1 hypothetical protein MM1S1530915_2354 [Mycobacteroides abscessus subsp. bolletii 1S-153-0915]EIU80058.1 hypothetical protein MM1S1540310_2366 [Mycobacteroides abscessus subsp. bolletii 1S-154-0310]EIU83496.1
MLRTAGNASFDVGCIHRMVDTAFNPSSVAHVLQNAQYCRMG